MAGKIIIGSDHAGFGMKEFLCSELAGRGFKVKDVGTYGADSVDYPAFAALVAKAVQCGEYARGIVVCGTGIGVSITANRFRGVRCSLCITPEMAIMTRKHNDSNVLAIGGRITTEETAREILANWLDTAYEGGRHQKRVEMMDEVVDEHGLCGN